MIRTKFYAFTNPSGSVIPSTIRNKPGDSLHQLKWLSWGPSKEYRMAQCRLVKVEVIVMEEVPPMPLHEPPINLPRKRTLSNISEDLLEWL